MMRKRFKLRQTSIDQFFGWASNDEHHVAEDPSVSRNDDTKDAGCSPMDFDNPFAVLPRPIMVHILEFLNDCSLEKKIPRTKYRRNLQGLIRLASCDKYMENLIYKGCPFLWEIINLAGVAKSVTDSQLASLLDRTNAVSVTRRLFLCGCSLVTGPGLLPLTGSQTLEYVDLRTQGNAKVKGTGLDDLVVSRVLMSMLLYNKLTFVYLESDRLYASGQQHLVPFPMQDFLVRFALSKARRFFDDQTVCSYCGCLLCNLVTTVKVLTLHNENKPIECAICGKHSCSSWSESSCPSLQKCSFCGITCCEECTDNCTDCSDDVCLQCLQARFCDTCKYSCCGNCVDVTTQCDYCDRFTCDYCGSGVKCDRCRRVSCPTCRHFADPFCIKSSDNSRCCFTKQCHFCAGKFGDGRTWEEYCHYCSGRFCSDCSHGHRHDCIKPSDEFAFNGPGGRRVGMKATKCSCEKNSLYYSQGQQFICSFIAKTNCK